MSEEQAIVKQAPAPPPFRIEKGVPIIENSDDLKRVATGIFSAGWCDRNMRDPAQVCCAIMHGMALGLNPLQAAQGIAVINGRPTVWGDTMMAIVHGSGELVEMSETIEGKGDKLTAVCVVRRKNGIATTGRFSVADAKRAGLWGKQGPWTQYPNRMLPLRARAFAVRDCFADLLRGVGIAEEAVDIPSDNTTASRASVASLPEPEPLEPIAYPEPVDESPHLPDDGPGSTPPDPLPEPPQASEPHPEPARGKKRGREASGEDVAAAIGPLLGQG